jgi:acyl-CoA hydrolase
MIGSEKVFVRLGRFNVVVLADGRTERTDAARDHAAARRSQEPRRYIKVTEAEVIYVAVDEAGNPIPIR